MVDSGIQDRKILRQEKNYERTSTSFAEYIRVCVVV